MISRIAKNHQLILDEAGYHFGVRSDDHLREELREIEGVPHASYLVKDGKVFVFEKLVSLVKGRQNTEPTMPLVDLVLDLIPEPMSQPMRPWIAGASSQSPTSCSRTAPAS